MRISRWLCLSLAVVAALAGVSCVEAQRPYHFATPRVADDAVDVVARTLAAGGHQPTTIDRKTGIVSTKWEDTGLGYGFVQGVKANIVRRFTVTIGRGAAGADVTVRMDGKRCQEGGYTVGDVDVRGACEAMDGIIASQQRDVDQLGAQIQKALQ